MSPPKFDLNRESLKSFQSDATTATSSSPRSPKSARPRRPRLNEKKSSGFITSSAARVRSALKAVTSPAKGRSSSSDGARAFKSVVEKERKLLKQKDASESAFFIASRWYQPPSIAHESTQSDSSDSTFGDDLSHEELFTKAFFAMRFVELYGLEPAFEKPRDTRPRNVNNLPRVDADWLRSNDHDAREVLNVVGTFFAEPWQRASANACGVLDKRNTAVFKEELVKVRHFLASDDVRRILIEPPHVVKSRNKQLGEARDVDKKYEERVQEKLEAPEEQERFESYRQWAMEFERTIQRRWSNDPPK